MASDAYSPLTQRSVDAVPAQKEQSHSREVAQTTGEINDESVQLAGAKLTRFLRYKERVTVGVESGSVYGAAILMPQLANTMSGSRDLTSMAISSWIFLIICIILHGTLLVFISKEERVMDSFAGQPYLCDFGAYMDETEHIGPGGTPLTPARLYTWSQWTTRVWIRDSLKLAFPDQADKIEKVVDPGEYGMESYTCRLFCVVIFIMSIVPEIWLCIGMAELVWYVPTKHQPWITLVDEEEDAGGAETCIKKVSVKVAGMSLFWKVINVVFILVPKCFLVYLTGHAGVSFLMETAGIDDIIVNSVALGFLLAIDEIIASNLMSAAANELLQRCDRFTIGERDDNETLERSVTLDRYYEEQRLSAHIKGFSFHFCYQLRKLAVVCLLTAYFLWGYYSEHCMFAKDGRLVSRPVSLPKSLRFGILNAFFRVPVEREDETYWSMPE